MCNVSVAVACHVVIHCLLYLNLLPAVLSEPWEEGLYFIILVYQIMEIKPECKKSANEIEEIFYTFFEQYLLYIKILP